MSKEPLFVSDLVGLAKQGKPIEPEEALASFEYCSGLGYVVQNGNSIKNIIDAIQPSLSYEQLKDARKYMIKAAEHRSFRHKGDLRKPYENAAKYIQELMDAMNPPEAS